MRCELACSLARLSASQPTSYILSSFVVVDDIVGKGREGQALVLLVFFSLFF